MLSFVSIANQKITSTMKLIFSDKLGFFLIDFASALDMCLQSYPSLVPIPTLQASD